MWYEKQLYKLKQIISNWSKKKKRKYKIHKLMRMMVILSEHADDCESCKMHISTIERIMRSLDEDKFFKEYKKLFNTIKKHLTRDHEYVETWEQILVFSCLTVSFMTVIGSLIISEWLALGLLGSILGIGVGLFMNKRHLSNALKI